MNEMVMIEKIGKYDMYYATILEVSKNISQINIFRKDAQRAAEHVYYDNENRMLMMIYKNDKSKNYRINESGSILVEWASDSEIKEMLNDISQFYENDYDTSPEIFK